MDQCSYFCNQPTAKCNVVSKQCEICDPVKDKDCTQLLGACRDECKLPAPTSLAGVWRGNAISKDFTRGEFDVTFSQDATELTMQFFDTKVERKWHATVAVSAPLANVEAGVTVLDLTFDKVPSADNLGVTAGKTVKALFQEKDGSAGLFKFLYLAGREPS